MSEQKRSKIMERADTIMTIHGIHTLFPEPAPIGMFDFMVKSCPQIHICPFVLTSRCHNTAELTEPTARAFANYILKQCDRVKLAKSPDRL